MWHSGIGENGYSSERERDLILRAQAKYKEVRQLYAAAAKERQKNLRKQGKRGDDDMVRLWQEKALRV